MGLDLILAALVLMAGIRGWLKGFVMQAIRLTGLIACVYVADPVRDLAKPRRDRPPADDATRSWSIACSGGRPRRFPTSSWSAWRHSSSRLSKRKRLGDAPPNRNDQFGGML